MKIEFVTSVAGARFSYDHGEIVDMTPEQAKEFLRARQAIVFKEKEVEAAPEKAVAAGPIETATQVVVENAGRRRGGRKNGVLSGLFQRP